jgi:hypothetical protein
MQSEFEKPIQQANGSHARRFALDAVGVTGCNATCYYKGSYVHTAETANQHPTVQIYEDAKSHPVF